MKEKDKIEEDILEYCGRYLMLHCYPPTYQEIMDHLGISSKATVFTYMRKLADKGKIILDERGDGSRKSRNYRISGYHVVKDE